MVGPSMLAMDQGKNATGSACMCLVLTGHNHNARVEEGWVLRFRRKCGDALLRTTKEFPVYVSSQFSSCLQGRSSRARSRRRHAALEFRSKWIQPNPSSWLILGILIHRVHLFRYVPLGCKASLNQHHAFCHLDLQRTGIHTWVTCSLSLSCSWVLKDSLAYSS